MSSLTSLIKDDIGRQHEKTKTGSGSNVIGYVATILRCVTGQKMMISGDNVNNVSSITSSTTADIGRQLNRATIVVISYSSGKESRPNRVGRQRHRAAKNLSCLKAKTR